MSYGLGHLVKTIVGTSPVKDSHAEQIQQNWVVDLRPVHPLNPFCSLDHIHPESIMKKRFGYMSLHH